MEKKKTSLGMDEHIEGMLCYLLLWLTGAFFLILEKKSDYVRFHAMQSLLVFILLSVLALILGFIPVLGQLLSGIIIPLVILFLWILLMAMAFKGERFKIPFIGHFAEVIIRDIK